MGLDNRFMIVTLTQPNWTFDPPLRLVGGLFSGDGNDGSFRGKVYADLVEQITGLSLYEDQIDQETIRQMADDLDVFTWPADTPTYLGVSREEFEDLKRLFRKAADTENVVLQGWA